MSFQLRPSSSGKTAAFNLASFTNLATSTTASIIKSGLSITPTGAWTGISAKNIGLYIPSVTGGTSNYGIYDLSGANDYFSGNVGIGTTTPWGILSVGAPVAGSQSPLFVVASSTPTTTTTVFIINASRRQRRHRHHHPLQPPRSLGPRRRARRRAFTVVNSASTTVFAVFDSGNAQLSRHPDPKLRPTPQDQHPRPRRLKLARRDQRPQSRHLQLDRSRRRRQAAVRLHRATSARHLPEPRLDDLADRAHARRHPRPELHRPHLADRRRDPGA